MRIDNLFQNLLQLLFADMEIHLWQQFIARHTSIHKSKILRQDLVEDKASYCRFHNACQLCAIWHLFAAAHFYLGMKSDYFIFICKYCLIDILEKFTLALCARSFLCQVVDTKYHILRRNRHRCTV